MAEYQTPFRIHFKISAPPPNTAWEVPNVVTQTPVPNATFSRLYQVTYATPGNPFQFAVTRVSSYLHEAVFDTNVGFTNLVYRPGLLEISTKMNNQSHLYGFGGRNQSQPGAYSLWSWDSLGLEVNPSLFGSHPFLLNYHPKEVSSAMTASGIFLLNSGDINVSFTPGVTTFSVSGGGVLDFYLFLGPSPELVVQQYLQLVGNPMMVPYWALGYHQSRQGYSSLADMQAVVSSFSQANLPLDTVWLDTDYMDPAADFAYNAATFPVEDVLRFVTSLRNAGQQFVPLVNAQALATSTNSVFLTGSASSVYLLDAENYPNFYVGGSGPTAVCFPDWFQPNTSSYWTQAVSDFYALSVPVDGLWVDTSTADTDPTNWRSVPSSAIGVSTTFGNTQNLFESQAAAATQLALQNLRAKRGLVVARATFPGAGSYTGQRLGANTATWEDLRSSIPTLFNANILGVPFSGVDICGYATDTTEELCGRWMQVGAFYPFARNHNQAGCIPQEPHRWASVAAASKQALQTRYLLLPYYYHLFFRAHVTGAVVVKPLFFAFPDALPKGKNIWDIVDQFMVGDALLVSPVLYQGATQVTAYFPSDEFWYNFFTGAVIKRGVGWATLPASLDMVNLHIREASIVPTQAPSLTTRASRLNPFSLVVALDIHNTARGSLFYDDGESLSSVELGQYLLLSFALTSNTSHIILASTVVNSYNPSTSLPPLNSVSIYGMPSPISGVSLAGANFTYNPVLLRLDVTNLRLQLNSPFVVALRFGSPVPENQELPADYTWVIAVVAILVLLVALAVVAFVL